MLTTGNHYRDTAGCLLYTCAFISQKRFCSGLDNAHEWHKILPHTVLCFYKMGQGWSFNRLTRRGVSSLPQTSRWRKSCSGKNKGTFLSQVHCKAYSIPHASFRGVVPSMRWTSEVVLCVLIAECHHCDQPMGGLFRAFYQICMLSFLLLHNEKKKKQERKSRNSRGKDSFWARSPSWRLLVSLGLTACVHTQAVQPQALKVLASPAVLGLAASLEPLPSQLPSRNYSGDTFKGRNHGV